MRKLILLMLLTIPLMGGAALADANGIAGSHGRAVIQLSLSAAQRCPIAEDCGSNTTTTWSTR